LATQTDVKAITVAASGNLGIGGGGTKPTQAIRIKAVYYSMSTGGTITVADTNATIALGSLTLVVPVGSFYVGPFPGEGIKFNGDPAVTFTTAVGSVTFFYG
jgi:hypothetical protein